MSKTIIIGGGISGLTAAYYLQKAGKDFQILEATERVGGRIKTDIVGGYRMDRGFQVFLTAYPEAQKILDYAALQLCTFAPGAVLLRANHKRDYIGDPLRQLSSLLPTLTTSAASLGDKFSILKTKTKLMRTTIDEIFEHEEVTTIEALKHSYGFSKTIIQEFLRPFYAGIFLENELTTSRRVFDFVFKTFIVGNVAVPRLGMEEIPKQIASHLDPNKILCNTRVTSIDSEGIVHTDTGQKLKADHLLLATEAT